MHIVSVDYVNCKRCKDVSFQSAWRLATGAMCRPIYLSSSWRCSCHWCMIYEWDMRNAVHQYATECREKRATHLQSVHCAQLLQHSYSPVPSVHTRSLSSIGLCVWLTCMSGLLICSLYSDNIASLETLASNDFPISMNTTVIIRRICAVLWKLYCVLKC